MTAVQADDRLASLDFERHNDEVTRIWDGLRSRKPIRVPMIAGTNTRYFMFNEGANPNRLTFRQYVEDPDVMFCSQLRFQRWSRFNLLQDQPLGLPEAWSLMVDFQNFHEAAWFGCPVEYMDAEVPDTLPAFSENPEGVMEHGLPDPFGGLYGQGLEFYEHMVHRAAGQEYLGRPIEVTIPGFGMGTDGVFTVACNIFGPEFVCEAMVEEPERITRLLEFLNDAIIAKLQAWWPKAGWTWPRDNVIFADDSIALISTAMYKEFVLPLHRKLYDTMASPVGRGMHLCGNASRHFPTLRDELGIQWFDTGFPIDHGALRQTLGPDVELWGGPHVQLVLAGSPEEVYEASKAVLQSGVMEGGRFVLREGNNLAPGTPLENTEAMHRAAKEWGVYA